jgi:hypothetical protein
MDERRPGRAQNAGRIVAVGMSVAIGLTVLGSSLLGQPGAQAPRSGNNPAESDAFSKHEQDQIAAKVLEDPDIKRSLSGHQLEALRVVKQLGEVKPSKLAPSSKLAEVLVFDHTTGKSERVLFDPDRNRLLRREPVQGSPSPSEQELAEAEGIASAEPVVARLLKEGCQLTGGFLADAPAGAPPAHRYMQMQVLSPDHKQIQRMVMVDLSTNSIATSR